MNPTASALQRAAACIASVVLPQVREQSEAAMRGVAAHKYLERVLMGMDKGAALADVPDEHRPWCASIDLSAIVLGLTNLRCEVAYAIDPFEATVRTFVQRHERDYSALTPIEFGGRGDMFGDARGMPVYSDFKTGQYVGAVSSLLQGLFFATALHLETGADRVGVQMLYVKEDGTTLPDFHVFTGMDFDRMLAILRDVHDKREKLVAEYAKGVVPNVFPGDHCKYCPAFIACPAKTMALRHLAMDLDGSLPVNMTVALTPEQATQGWLKFKAIQPLFDSVEKQLKSYAREINIRLPNGKVVRPVATSRRTIDGDRAMALLRQYGATEDDLKSCIKMSSFDRIQETNE